MPGPLAVTPASPIDIALLQSSCLSGSWQMAIDAALLQRRQPSLRFYRWSRPTLSLGFHQREVDERWLDWQRRGQLDLVRRPTGGGAVLHGGDVCYSLVLPCERLARPQVYGWLCGWLQAASASLGEVLRFGDEPADRQSDCFARSTAADLISTDGQKRIGNAQRWQQGWLLQHGSIQLQPDGTAWKALLGSQPPRSVAGNPSLQTLTDALLAALPDRLRLIGPAQPLGAELLALAGSQLEHYRLDGGVASVTSPLASMARTT